MLKSDQCGIETADLARRAIVLNLGSNRTNVGLKPGWHRAVEALALELKSDQCGIETVVLHGRPVRADVLKSDQCGIET